MVGISGWGQNAPHLSGSQLQCAHETPLRVLFLQGLAGPFFARMATALIARGHVALRVNFNGGDRLDWTLPGAVEFRGDAAGWPAICRDLARRHAITDLVLFGDCRPLHRAAIDVAHRLGLRIHVFEEGYIRPGWITMEPDGVNGYSDLPRTAGWFLAQAAASIAPSSAAGVAALDETGSFARRARHDIAYTLACLAWRPVYRAYRTHRPWHPLVEYAGWAWQLATGGYRRRQSDRACRQLQPGRRYFLFTLQLDCDSQVRMHAGFKHGVGGAIARVLQSFATHADPASVLVIKQHPLENGLRDWRRVVDRAARRLDVRDRVVFLTHGDLSDLLGAAAGLVTINSTTGLQALAAGVPVCTLGRAVYDLPGLTTHGSVDAFWQDPARPDAQLLRAFHTVLATRCMIRGGFFTEAGLALAVQGAVRRLEAARLHVARAPHAPAPAVPRLALVG